MPEASWGNVASRLTTPSQFLTLVGNKMEHIDKERCLRVMEDINVGGLPIAARLYLIEEAIAKIQASGSEALKQEYLGIKNYAGFGDQREDHEYGYGPSHGSIVFRIERTNRNRGIASAVLGDNHIYLLECVRDFNIYDDHNDLTNHLPKRKNLCQVLGDWRRHQKLASEYEQVINSKEVTIHVPQNQIPV